MRFKFLLWAVASISTSCFGQSDVQVLDKINKQIDSFASIEKSLTYFSDVYGPRLMGTPNYYNSVLWAKKELEGWGVSVRLQNFDNDNVGWAVKGFSMAQVEPNYFHINAYPLAFSKSTNGSQIGEPVIINSFDGIYEHKGELKNKIILLKGYYRPVKNVGSPMSERLSDDLLNRAAANSDPNDVILGYHSRRSTVDVFGYRARVKLQRKKFLDFCESEGALAIIEPSNFPYGILHADGNRTIPSLNKSTDIKPIASFVMSNEHFGRIVRLVELGALPKLKVDLQTEFYNDPKYNVNLVAEIEGNDERLKDEVVIIGAHLDSWHAGSGAVDNASNCSVMLEAIRALRMSGVKNKRTIRLILWGGEEQVFAGSKSYVSDNVGDFTSGAPGGENKKISAYLNLDNGAGMIRGVYMNGNDEVEPFLAHYLLPFGKSKTLTIQNSNQTDHELFDYFNIPAFQFIQDPLDYISAIHHTNMDLYEYVPLEDQKYNAKLVAYLAYKIAQEDGLLPRKKYNSPIPSKEGNAEFFLQGNQGADKVSLVGDFNNWNMFGTPLYKVEDGWECKIDLPKGKYYYKFIVDGYWTADPQTPKGELTKDGKGHGGLTVKRIK